ncbi:MAG: hypothetical protein A2X88_06200 [Deltaproteobacteria bacterium GWC2_65_14]|nr:MAG: hypothetical protein A2X88_06200 [Deltaproteobacteria bacterium GWC2_65_14]
MDCDKVQELLTEHLDGSLGDGEGRGVELHLRECPRCAAEEKALKETLSLLRSLPPEKAPPELLEGVRQKLALESPKPAAGKGLFASPRIRIPIEAAAVVLLFLLVYGIQRQFPAADRPAAPPPRVESSKAPAGEAILPADPAERNPAEREAPGRLASARNPAPGKDRIDGTRAAAERPEEAAAPKARAAGPESPRIGEDRTEPSGASGYRAAERMDAKEGAGTSSPVASAPLPAVPATRVSTGAESVVPRGREEERAEAPAPFRVFAAPPSRLVRPMSYGREVILEVAAEQRPGLEERIVRVVEGFSGSILREWHFLGTPPGEAGGAPVLEGPMRIQIPAGSAEAFLTELRKLGTIPPEGMPASINLHAGPTQDIAAYTVRIRVR